MKLIDKASRRAAIRHFSTVALGISSAILGAWALMPEDLKAELPEGASSWVAKIVLGVTIWGLVGKFVAQRPRGGDQS